MQRCRAACSVDLAMSPYLPAPGIYGSDFWEECRKEAGGVISCYSRLRSPPSRHPCPDSLLRPGLLSSSGLTQSSFWQSFTQKRRNAESWRTGRLYPGLAAERHSQWTDSCSLQSSSFLINAHRDARQEEYTRTFPSGRVFSRGRDHQFSREKRRQIIKATDFVVVVRPYLSAPS